LASGGLRVEEVIGASDAYRPISLDTPVGDGEDAETYGELIGENDTAIGVDDVAGQLARSCCRSPAGAREG
jgi:hypothetical protein